MMVTKSSSFRPHLPENRAGDPATPSFFVLHFWPMSGGFHKRIEMLLAALGTVADVSLIATIKEFVPLVLSGQFGRKHTSVIIYTSLLGPLAVCLRIFYPSLGVYYMVRGDEISWARHAGRTFRAGVAWCFQKLLSVNRCTFVFVSGDLTGLFLRRLGRIRRWRLLPNTLGRPLPPIRHFDGRVAVVGDFGSVKNIECVIDSLDGGEFCVDLYGNRSMPEARKRSWLHAHGFVKDLKSRLGSSSLVVLSSVSEGFPNVLLDALEAGCGVVVHNDFPFCRLPVAGPWRFDMRTARPHLDVALPSAGAGTGLLATLRRLRREQPDFKQHNRAFVQLVESDWQRRVLDVFELGRGRREEGVAA